MSKFVSQVTMKNMVIHSKQYEFLDSDFVINIRVIKLLTKLYSCHYYETPENTTVNQ